MPQHKFPTHLLTCLAGFILLITSCAQSNSDPYQPGLSSSYDNAGTQPVRIATIPRDPAPAISAPRAIVIDYDTGRILYKKNHHDQCAIASTQKLLTALCVIDAGDLSDPVVVESVDTKVVPTKIYIKPGQRFTRYELVKALTVKSGNDVAMALARDVAGSKAAFAQVMNRKALSLGMRNSNFVNPHGLTESGQYSTAYDLAILAREAYSNPTIRSFTRINEYTFRFPDGRTKTLSNTNKLLDRVAYCTGMKTGTTRASGRCLVSSGEYNGRTAICVVLGASSSTIWNESEKLLRWSLER